jgi:hypothetical protein
MVVCCVLTMVSLYRFQKKAKQLAQYQINLKWLIVNIALMLFESLTTVALSFLGFADPNHLKLSNDLYLVASMTQALMQYLLCYIAYTLAL